MSNIALIFISFAITLFTYAHAKLDKKLQQEKIDRQEYRKVLRQINKELK
jgi:hypothetical protein